MALDGIFDPIVRALLKGDGSSGGSDCNALAVKVSPGADYEFNELMNNMLSIGYKISDKTPPVADAYSVLMATATPSESGFIEAYGFTTEFIAANEEIPVGLLFASIGDTLYFGVLFADWENAFGSGLSATKGVYAMERVTSVTEEVFALFVPT